MTNLDGWIWLEWLASANVAVLGAALLYWARPISEKYCAWTTKVREKFPKISRPPNFDKAKQNVNIMTKVFRVLGAAFFVEAVYGLIDLLYLLRR
jgi:hypothetical protein